MKREIALLFASLIIALPAQTGESVVVPRAVAKIMDRAPIDLPEKGTDRETTVSAVKVLANGKAAGVETRIGRKIGSPQDAAINKSLANSKYAPALDEHGNAIDSLLVVATVFGTRTQTQLSTESLVNDEKMLAQLSNLWNRYVYHEELLVQHADLCEQAGSPVRNLKAYILQINVEERLQFLKLEKILIDVLKERRVPDPDSLMNGERKALAEQARKATIEHDFKKKDPKNVVPGCILEAKGIIKTNAKSFFYEAKNREQFELLMSL